MGLILQKTAHKETIVNQLDGKKKKKLNKFRLFPHSGRRNASDLFLNVPSNNFEVLELHYPTYHKQQDVKQAQHKNENNS